MVVSTTTPPGDRPSTATGEAAAELLGVTRRFRGVTALEDVSLRIDRAEAVGLIGPNGSGKTTLLNILSGALRAHAGKVVVGGREATRTSSHGVARMGVGRTFQQIRLFGALTVRQNVELGAIARRRGPAGVAAADELLEHMHLGAHADRYAAELDYGSQRRLEIARALAGQPHLLLLDEPAAGMNETESDDLLSAIRAARERDGCGVLIVEHDLRLLMRLCDRVHVLAEGRTLSEGTPAEVQHDPKVIDAYLGVASRAPAHNEENHQ